MIGRRQLLAGAAAGMAVPALAQTTSLRDLATSCGLIFGSAAATYELKDRDFVAALVRDAAQLVPEYEMKRDVLEPAPGHYDFSDLDRLFSFAARNGLSMRGHTLVWYYANPAWLPPLLAAKRDERLLTRHVETVLKRYPMMSVDVVNEALAPPGEELRADGFRPSPGG